MRKGSRRIALISLGLIWIVVSWAAKGQEASHSSKTLVYPKVTAGEVAGVVLCPFGKAA
jgi:hypothetical protein